MEENITTIEELNATIEALKEEISALTKENETLKSNAAAIKKDADLYKDFFTTAASERDRVKGAMAAIATLLEAIK